MKHELLNSACTKTDTCIKNNHEIKLRHACPRRFKGLALGDYSLSLRILSLVVSSVMSLRGTSSMSYIV